MSLTIDKDRFSDIIDVPESEIKKDTKKSKLKNIIQHYKGGSGSGHFGRSAIPNKRGGSLPGKGINAKDAKYRQMGRKNNQKRVSDEYAMNGDSMVADVATYQRFRDDMKRLAESDDRYDKRRYDDLFLHKFTGQLDKSFRDKYGFDFRAT